MSKTYQVLRYRNVTNYNRDDYCGAVNEHADLGLFASLDLAKSCIEEDKQRKIKAIIEDGEEPWVCAGDQDEIDESCDDETLLYHVTGILHYNCCNDDITTIRYYICRRQIKGLA